MKTTNAILAAKSKIADALAIPGLSNQQKTLFAGMMVALNWTLDDPSGSTLARLLRGDAVEPGHEFEFNFTPDPKPSP